MFQEISNKNRGVLLILLLNLCLTLILDVQLNIWIDEVFSLQATNRDFGYMLSRAFYFEKQPPFYYIILQLWRQLNESIFFARFLSTLCVLIGIFVSVKASERYLGERFSVWTAALLAFNPLVLYCGVEIRQYALIFLLSSLLILFFYDGFLSKNSTLSARVFYVIFAVLALYTQYFLGFLLAANAVVLVCLREWSNFRKYLLSMIAVAFCFSPMLFVLIEQLGIHSRTVSMAGTKLSTLGGIRLLYQRAGDYFIPWTSQDSLWTLNWLNPWILKVAISALIIIAIRMFKHLSNDRVALIVMTAMLYIILFFLKNIVGPGFMLRHHTTVLFLPTILSILAIVGLAKSKVTVSIFFSIILIFSINASGWTYSGMSKMGDWKRVAAYVMKIEEPREPIFFFRNDGLPSFAIYYKGVNRMVSLPDDSTPENWSIPKMVLSSEKQVRVVLDNLPFKYERFWLVTWGVRPYLGIDFHYEILEDFIHSNCKVISSRQFYGSQVRLIKWNREGNP